MTHGTSGGTWPAAAAHGLGAAQLGELVQWVVSALAEADAVPAHSSGELRLREARAALAAAAAWLARLPSESLSDLQAEERVISIIRDAARRTPTGHVAREAGQSPPAKTGDVKR